MQALTTVYIFLSILLLGSHVRSFHLNPTTTKFQLINHNVSVSKRKMSTNEVNEKRDDQTVPHCTNVLFVECGYVEKTQNLYTPYLNWLML